MSSGTTFRRLSGAALCSEKGIGLEHQYILQMTLRKVFDCFARHAKCAFGHRPKRYSMENGRLLMKDSPFVSP